MLLKKALAISFISITTALSIAGYLFFAKQRPALAQTANYHYISSGAIGNNDGSDWTNAWTDLPATFVRGHTYWVADGYYGRHTFNTPISSTTYIYIKKATVFAHGADTGWDDIFGDGQAVFVQSGNNTTDLLFQTDYWDMDGVVGMGNGFSEQYGFKVDYTYVPTGNFSSDGYAVYIYPHNYINFSHIEITGNNEGSLIALKKCEYVTVGIYGYNSNYINVSYVYLRDFTHSMLFLNTTSNWIIEHNYFNKMLGGNFYNADGTCSTSPSYIHHTPISISNSNNMKIRHNTFYNIDGTAALDFINTSSSNYDIYGNIFYSDDAKYTYTNGVIAGANSTNATNFNIYNNTFYNLKYTASGNDFAYGIIGFPVIGSNNNNMQNNVFIGMLNTYGNGNYRFINMTGDHNFSDKNFAVAQNDSQIIDSATLDNYFINKSIGDFRLKQSTDAGIFLSSSYSMDFLGNTRGSDGVWDRGAYEYIQTPPPLKGDFNSDSKVNDLDFAEFKNAFKSIFNSIFDLNSDNTIDVKDLGVLMSGWLP